MKKLQLKKTVVSELSDNQMNQIKGGDEFTYTLSLGERCRKSADFTHGTTCRCIVAQ